MNTQPFSQTGINDWAVLRVLVCTVLFDCMFLSYHIRVTECIRTLQLPECQGTPHSKQAPHLKFTWQQQDSNPQPFGFPTKTQPFNQFARVFIYKLSGCGFKSRCCHLNFRYRTCLSNEFLEIQAVIECRFTLKRGLDMIKLRKKVTFTFVNQRLNWHFALYGSLEYKYISPISGQELIRFSNAFGFPDPEPSIINILY